MDARGNFEEIGKSYKEGRTLERLKTLILKKVSSDLPGVKATAAIEKFSMGRKINVLVLDAGTFDLGQRDVIHTLKQRILGIMNEFNFARGNAHNDTCQTSFHTDVRIESVAYLLQDRRAGTIANDVESKFSLSEFKRQLKPGDIMERMHGGKSAILIVKQVRSKDIVFEDRSRLGFGRSDEFACDGELVRFARGNENEPGRHLLYRWRPAAASEPIPA